jgi:hypothetical protein
MAPHLLSHAAAFPAIGANGSAPCPPTPVLWQRVLRQDEEAFCDLGGMQHTACTPLVPISRGLRASNGEDPAPRHAVTGKSNAAAWRLAARSVGPTDGATVAGEIG